MQAQYWLVGAARRGTEHQDARFIKEGIWVLGWREKQQPDQFARAKRMKPGDRIVIKRMKRRKRGLRIMHLGIIKAVIPDTEKALCTVDWVATNLNRDIGESRGCFKSVHGPYKRDERIQEVFCL
jgi:hypothetical protein